MYADKHAAEAQWRAGAGAEKDALGAICAHRCGSPAELARKLRYLAPFRAEFSPEQDEALFASFPPEGEAL